MRVYCCLWKEYTIQKLTLEVEGKIFQGNLISCLHFFTDARKNFTTREQNQIQTRKKDNKRSKEGRKKGKKKFGSLQIGMKQKETMGARAILSPTHKCALVVLYNFSQTYRHFLVK